MLRKPPEIFITTPESLNLILSSPKARDVLATVETLILDEIHAVAAGKRGSHLMTAVERLTLVAGESLRWRDMNRTVVTKFFPRNILSH